jgi:hypothetical protein
MRMSYHRALGYCLSMIFRKTASHFSGSCSGLVGRLVNGSSVSSISIIFRVRFGAAVQAPPAGITLPSGPGAEQLRRSFVAMRRRRQVRLSERASLISSYDLEREEDGAEHKKQNADRRCAARFERHANCRQHASDDNRDQSTKLLHQQKVSVTRTCHHDQPRCPDDVPPSPTPVASVFSRVSGRLA